MRAMTLAIILNAIVTNNTAINWARKYSAACYGLRDADFKGKTMKSWVVGDHSWIPHFKLSSILHDYRSWRVVTLWNVGDIEERTIIRKV